MKDAQRDATSGIPFDTPTTRLTDVTQSDTLVCVPETIVRDAALQMQRRLCSSVIVAGDDRIPLGIWTERDALKLDLSQPSAWVKPLRDIMSSPVKTLPGTASTTEARALMETTRIRHIVVVNNDGRIYGLYSQTDLVRTHGAHAYLRLREVRSVLSSPHLTLHADMPLSRATRKLAEAGANAAVVRFGDDTIPGLITERDIIRQLASDPDDPPLSAIASHPLITVDADDSLLKARQIMFNRAIRRLGVTDSNSGEILGLLDIAELLSSTDGALLDDLVQSLQQTREKLEEVAARKSAEQKDIEREYRLLATAFRTGQALMICDAEGNIERVNTAFTTTTGYESTDVLGVNPRILSSGTHDHEFFRDLWQQLLAQGHWEGEIWNRRKNGELYPQWEAITAVFGVGGEIEHYVAVFHEISEQKRLEKELERLATHDRLTGIYNRTKLYELLDFAREENRRYDRPFSVIMFDIDHFKSVNDRHGHGVGDDVLVELSGRITSVLRETDHFGRWGGEEFLVLATNTDTDAALTLAERLRQAVADQPFRAVGQVTISLGVAQAHRDESSELLEERVDRALYRAKHLGRNQVVAY